MADLRSSEVTYECKVCSGHGEVDIGWHVSIIVDCKNCEGTGRCNWIRNVIPIYTGDLNYTADAEL